MTNSIIKWLQGNVVISAFLLLTNFMAYSQDDEFNKAMQYLNERNEVVFKFECSENCTPNELTHIISIDAVKDGWVTAYANKKQFDDFLKYAIPYTVLTPPSLQPGIFNNQDKATTIFPGNWDTYPSYEEYITTMQDFASNYPDICMLDTIGTSVNGRLLVGVKISDNVQTKEAEPKFLFTSTIHGDEVTGFMLLLRLTDYLLSNYSGNTYIQQLVDNTEIWINPNANPDGTYYTGNASISGARRNNAHDQDLNRSFPDPTQGGFNYSDGWEPETLAMMQFMMDHQFTLSANYHGGAEVMNYPWDTWSRSHADEEWFIQISEDYANRVKTYGGDDYFSDIIENGVTNGYDWYTIQGGRQDFTTYYANGREITIEVSANKLPPESEMPNYWNWNREAMLHYIEQCQYGVHGIVTDALTSAPLEAMVYVLNHDTDSSYVLTDSVHGDYHRLLAPGTYDLAFRCEGYSDRIIHGVVLAGYTSRVDLNVTLSSGNQRLFNSSLEMQRERPYIFWNGNTRELQMNNIEGNTSTIQIINTSGQIILTKQEENMGDGLCSIYLPNTLPKGIYICKVSYNNHSSGMVRFIAIQ